MKIYAYSMHSEGARNLAKALDTVLIKHKNSKFKWSTDKVINWGHSNPPGPCMNMEAKNAIDKRITYDLLDQASIPCPPYTKDKETALEWIKKDKVVLARTLTKASEGRGIVILNVNKDINAPLYTQYIKKKHEFRVHVVNGKPIKLQQKKLRKNLQHNIIRNTKNGYVFGHISEDLPVDIKERLSFLAVSAVKVLKLDFGAVDIIWNKHHNKLYVLEVNTAPGISELTAKTYADAFKNA